MDQQNTREARSLAGEDAGPVRDVALSPDGQVLATGSADGTVRLWHVPTGDELATLTANASIFSVAFFPSGDTLAAGGAAVAIDGGRVLIGAPADDTNGFYVGQAHLFDATSGALLQTFDDPTVTTWDVFGRNVALDGDRVLIGAWGDDTYGVEVGQAHLFDASTGTLLQTFNDPTPTTGDHFGRSVALDGNRVLIGAGLDDTNGADVARRTGCLILSCMAGRLHRS